MNDKNEKDDAKKKDVIDSEIKEVSSIHTSESSPEEWEDVGRENIDAEIKHESSNIETNRNKTESQDALPIHLPSKDSNISMEGVDSDDVDIIDSEEVQHQLDKMVSPEIIHEQDEDSDNERIEFHSHPKPKLHLLTKPIDNNSTEVETDSVDTPRPEEIMKITDKMVLGFDIDAYKRRKDDKIIEEEEVSTGNNSPAIVAAKKSTSTSSSESDESIDDSKDKIGISKEAECILSETIKIEKIEDKPYEVEDVLEIIDETHKESGNPVEMEEIKKRLKAEAKDLDEAIHVKILEVKEKENVENDEQQQQQQQQLYQENDKVVVEEDHKNVSSSSGSKIVKAEDHESTTDETDNSESSESYETENGTEKNKTKTEQEIIQGLPISLQKIFKGNESEEQDKSGMELNRRQKADLKEKRKRRETTSPRPQDLIGALRFPPSNFPQRQKLDKQQSLDTPMAIKVPPPTPSEGLDSLKLKSPPEFAAPGPEVFHEVPIDVPVDEKRHIAFDIDDLTDSIKRRISDDDEENNQPYEKSRMEKFVNYLLCRKDLVNQKLSEKPVKFWDLFKYGNRGDTILVIFGLLLAAVCGICQPLFAILSGRLANVLLLLEIDDPEFFSEGTQACVLFVVIGAFLVAIAFVQFLCFNIACTRITRRIRNEYLLSILRQNPAWFEKNHSGALNTKLNDNIERIYEGIGDKLGLLTRNMVQYITGIIVALVVNWQMALPLLIFSPIITFAMAFSGRKISKASRDEMKVYAQAGCIAEEAITAYRTVAAFNAQETEVHRYKQELENGVKSGVRKAVYSGALSGVLLALVMIFMGTALLYGTFLHSIGIITTPGDVFIVLMAIMSGAYHLGNASPHLMVLLTARVAAASVYKTIARIPKIDPYSNQGRKLYDLQGKIIFKNVSFRYPSRPETKVLKSFSFTCNAGQTIALVGHSGSGKSTIVGILNRLYEFETGNVTIDGVDIRELNVKWLRTVIGTVQQEPIIFNDTVENNIKQGCDSLTEKEMVEACKQANAHDFIESLPEGYNTRIGEGGVQLSGGQKQRIAIARTLARNPKILLLDEATSALDTHSEAMVQTALNNASKNRTTIVIAHRLSTIRDADRIIVMHKGRFVEMGTHNDLIQRKGAYSKLVLAQELNMGDGKKDDSDDDRDAESIERDLISPDQPTSNMTLASKDVRESVRQSFQRDFLASDHVGDAETEAYNIELEKSGHTRTSFAQIFLDARELWPLLSVALGICFFNALAMPVNAFIYGQAFQMFEDGRRDNVGEAFIFFLFFVGLGVVALIASFCTTYLFGKIGEKLTMSMRVRAFRSIIYQDGSYFDNPAHTPGKLITRLATDAPNVKAAMDTRLARVAQGILALLAAVVISAFMDWKFALTCSMAFVFLGIFQFTIAKMAHSQAVKFAQSDEAGRIAIEAIENVRTIQLLTSEHNVHNSFTFCSLKRQKAEMRKAPIEALNFATTHGLQYFTLAFCYMMGFIFVVNGWTYKVTLFQVVQTIYFGAIAVIQATEFFPEFVKSRLAASLMYGIINRQPRTGKIDAGEKISIEGDVSFENVYFAYPMRPKHAVMKGISLQARPGQTVALVGPSGSGKSTVIALLERLYDPSVGAVKIDGKDLKNLCLFDIRNQMSLVEQQPRLFSGTIKDNIAYGLDITKISMDEIVEAATLANAASFISTLPLGYDTPLGEKGAQLSGGQKQRIAIARAVIRKPKILLLDEATSALDSTSEKAVQEALDVARLGRTCITIAHRLSSIQNSDQILFVENGKVRERGTHSELIQQQGKYFNLTQQQYLGS